MSYCVNCGVELDSSAKKCPLCKTVVLNPNTIEQIMWEKEPFPDKKGEVETVKRKDFAILILVVLIATSVTCGVLNILVFTASRWSLAIIGACAIIGVLLLPAFIPKKLPVYFPVFFDGTIVALYLYMLTYMTKGKDWFWALGLPVVAMVTILVCVFIFCTRAISKSFLAVALYLFTVLGLFCAGLEMLIDYFVNRTVQLGWSAVVLTVCIIIDIALITMLSHRRLRNAVRKRLHF